MFLRYNLTNSTFAWFSVQGATAKAVNDSEGMGVTENTYALGDIKLTVSLGTLSSVKLSDTDGYSYVLLNGVKTKDTSVAQNDSSMFTSGALTITATIKPSGEAQERAATSNELKEIADNYRIVLVASNNAKINGSSGAEALAATANNTLYSTFTISDQGAIGALSITTVYAGVQGKDDANDQQEGNQPEVPSDFTTNVPTVTATLQYQSADDPVAWSDVAEFVEP